MPELHTRGKKFQWTSECEEAFEALKKHLGEVSLLSKPQPDESPLLYLAVLDVAVSAVLIREENERQLPVYYISKALLPVETRYPDMEKLALTLITASRKLRPYFQTHSIQVLTNFPLKQVMQKTDASGHLLKWAIELSEFDLTFRPRHAFKRQALANFMVEFTKTPEMEAIMEPTKPPTWKLFVDGSSGEAGAGAGIVLESPEGHKLSCAVRFSFKASNNAAEYEALLAGLRLAKEMRVRKLLASSDSQLIANQVRTDSSPLSRKCTCRRPLKISQQHGPELLNIVPIEHLSKPSTSEGEEVLWIEGTPLWMQPIIAYLKEQTLPASRGDARKLRRRTVHFVLQEDTLYKRGFASPLLRCIGGEEATYILREIHEGICGNHSEGTALAHKVLRQCYFWPTLKSGAEVITRGSPNLLEGLLHWPPPRPPEPPRQPYQADLQLVPQTLPPMKRCPEWDAPPSVDLVSFGHSMRPRSWRSRHTGMVFEMVNEVLDYHLPCRLQLLL
ncbi:uncharacterized protein LOC111404749 [Olea europaea var. sylvestris]|uniref:uncharacterized protein LOC111404749 n=1 Tax=Olea europaea var. sylvestris TaxID=158386 RepID=UPI000C1D4B67|nr:uncharacterized protein LOC111404749 [Olea europaea var. sylvestris]